MFSLNKISETKKRSCYERLKNNNSDLHITNIKVLPNISSDDVPQLVQISQIEVRMVPITSLHVFVNSEK